MFDPEIAQRFKDKSLRESDLHKLVEMYKVVSEPEDRINLFADIVIAMHLLTRKGTASIQLHWFKQNIEAPTHIFRGGESEMELIYNFSEERIYCLGFDNEVFSQFSRICCFEDWDAFWASCEEVIVGQNWPIPNQ